MKRIRSIIVTAISAIMLLSVCAVICNAEDKYDSIVEAAIESFADTWKTTLTDDSYQTDGYVSIKNTRIIVLKEDPVFSSDTNKRSYEAAFKGARYVVEFLFYADYFGSAPYYSYPGINNAVLVFEDGSCETVKNPVDTYRSRSYETDYSGFIEECIDLGGDYNRDFDFIEE